MSVSSGTTPSGTESSGYVGPNSLPGILNRDSHPDDDNKVTRSPIKKPPRVPVEYSVTPVLRVRIVEPLDAATAEKW